MRRCWRFILVALLGAASIDANAVTNAPMLGFTGQSVLAAPFTELLEDKSGSMNLDQARASNEWRPVSANALSLGFSSSVWWVRLRIANTNQRTTESILDLGNSRQDYVRWHVLRRAGAFVEEVEGGDRLPYSARQFPSRNLVLPLRLEPREQVEVLMRLQSFDGLFDSIPLTIWSRNAFLISVDRESYLLALFHGGLLALALFNLLLFFATGGRAFGWYVLHLVCFSAWSFTLRGFAFQYFWPNSPGFNNDFLNVAAAWTFASMGCFSLVYLRLREQIPPWLYRAFSTLIALNVLVAIPAILGYFALSAAISQFTGAITAMAALATALWLLRRGSRQARFYVIAFSVLAVGTSCYVLQVISVLPTNWFTTWGVQIGSAIEMLLLALGLADSMNTLKAQKIEAERQAREAQEALATRLAQQVNERTEALELANRRLHELAITDELTGAFNRRHFSAFSSAALTHRDRNEPLAFCIFDVDFFKAFNERYGHEAGNAALRAIAQALRAKLRRSADVLFRLGGEEFGVLFTATSAENARQFVDKLRLAVKSLAIPHEGSPYGTITASFGVGWWDVGSTTRLTPDQMYAVADNMVYEAKDAGRDRVAIDAHSASDAQPAAPVAASN